MDNLVHRIWRGGTVGIIAVMCRQFFGNLMQPFVQLACGARIERRERPDDTRLTLRDNQFWPRHDEQR